MKPQRIKLSRARGFRLQDVSRAINGLPARAVTRPGIYGNPFLIEPQSGVIWEPRNASWQPKWSVRCLMNPHHDGKLCPPDFVTCLDRTEAAHHAVARFRAVIAPHLDLAPLRGHNLACHCPLDAPCHADVLLELANREGDG